MEYTFENEGIRMNGDFVRYDSPIENINPVIIEKLNNNVATAWSLFLVHKSIVNQTIEIKKELNKHLVCPINPEAIKKLARDEAEKTIREQPKKLRDKTIPVIKDIVLLLTMIALLISFINK